jgi:hypothetical protein
MEWRNDVGRAEKLENMWRYIDGSQSYCQRNEELDAS